MLIPDGPSRTPPRMKPNIGGRETVVHSQPKTVALSVRQIRSYNTHTGVKGHRSTQGLKVMDPHLTINKGHRP